jgi:threonine dehydrogenase-like Zn-dependent dehydrogenase
MTDKLKSYKQAQGNIGEENRLWPLYGVGLENLGRDDRPIDVGVPAYGPDELLVRHDACGICFSDIKVLNAGQQHPRIFKNMQEDPVVLGHEVSMTVVGVGENLAKQYKVGDRFIIQADIYDKGVNYAYGYMLQGGMSQYAVIGQRILNGDDGNYLLPVQPTTGYAESALAEPWACVIAAYELKYRTALKAGGFTWLIGTKNAESKYEISEGFDAAGHPAKLALTNVPAAFAADVRARAEKLGVEVIDIDLKNLDDLAPVDDIVILGADADLIEKVSPKLADYGIVAILARDELSREVQVDVGRVHYNRWTYVGGPGPDIAEAYNAYPIPAELKAEGKAWFVGAGGPMGQMHVQRSVTVANPPDTIVCTDLSLERLQVLEETIGPEARARGIDFVCLAVTAPDYRQQLAKVAGNGFDNVVILAPAASIITDCANYMADQGIMNIFAGLKRGTMAALDLSAVYQRNLRFIGHTASTIDDLRLMLSQTESGQLSPNRSVVAVGSLNAFKDGLAAVRDAKYPGKVVIFPQISELPLTPIAELAEKMPSVFAKMRDGREWTVAAETEFLELMLP